MPPNNHACPPLQPCMPPTTMHTPLQPCMAPLQPHMPPQQPHMPPGNHTCPQQPCMPPSNHACPWQPCIPPATMHARPVNRMTNRCKNITLSQTSFAGSKNISFEPPFNKIQDSHFLGGLSLHLNHLIASCVAN